MSFTQHSGKGKITVTESKSFVARKGLPKKEHEGIFWNDRTALYFDHSDGYNGDFKSS